MKGLKVLDMKKESELSMENASGLSVDEQYLVKPFNANLERIMADWASEKTSSNVMNILVGGTGLGKTYNTAMNFIPQLFRNGLKFMMTHSMMRVTVKMPMDRIFVLQRTLRPPADFFGKVKKFSLSPQINILECSARRL
jgi:hypothetical protein